MTRITFDLTDVFKTSQYTAYLPHIQRAYSDKFPSWERIEFHISELTSTRLNMPVKDKFDFATWGCKVALKIPRNPDLFFSRLKESLEWLAEKHQGTD